MHFYKKKKEKDIIFNIINKEKLRQENTIQLILNQFKKNEFN